MTEKRIYSFIVASGISLHINVEASSVDEAIEIAGESGIMSLCHYCARGSEGEWSTSGELDCDPYSAPLEDVLVDGEPLAAAELERANDVWGGHDPGELARAEERQRLIADLRKRAKGEATTVAPTLRAIADAWEREEMLRLHHEADEARRGERG